MFNDPDLIIRKLRKTLGRILQIVGLILGVFEAHHIFEYLQLSEDMQKIVAIWYIILICSVALLVLSLRFGFADRKEKFANIMPRISDINTSCKNILSLIRLLQENDSRLEDRIPEIRGKFRDIMDDVAVVFAMLTNTNCRATVKIVSYDRGASYVVGFVRDNNSFKVRPRFDDERAKNHNDPLDKNTQFKRLFSDTDPNFVFTSNNLAKEKSFNNTSIKAYNPDANGEVRERSLLERILGDPWPLPYRSTITVAIRHAENFRRAGEPTVVGFLCVDSESRGVFSARWDHHICNAVADALYHPLNEFLEIVSRAETGLGLDAFAAQTDASQRGDSHVGRSS